jgi:hypothetical protein
VGVPEERNGDGASEEVFGELEMLQLLDQFFDRAIFYAAVGYEKYVASHRPELSSVR